MIVIKGTAKEKQEKINNWKKRSEKWFYNGKSPLLSGYEWYSFYGYRGEEYEIYVEV
ncbi:MAG: hypothetical protein ACRCX7_11300 [Cetobacterium sp.]|uniref:hypothetical protein n=1 Tax=Cetobacterium sp. TaxID=2071632 RepID=UPI003F3ED6ED